MVAMADPLQVHVNSPTVVGSVAWFRELAKSDWSDLNADVYLAFSDAPRMRLAGFLVSRKGSIHQVVAYCPLMLTASNRRGRRFDHRLRNEIDRQIEQARTIASAPDLFTGSESAILLARKGTEDCPMPRWVYGLTCIPVSRPWNGNFLNPTPFCASLEKLLKSQQTRPSQK
jgi:hypothetical protein